MNKIILTFIILGIGFTACKKTDPVEEKKPIANKFIKVSIPDSLHINKLNFIDKANGIITCDMGYYLKTNNTGEHWSVFSNDTLNTNLNQSFFLNENFGFISDREKNVYFLKSGVWQHYNFPVTECNLTDLQFLSENTWFAATDQNPDNISFLLKTMNKGVQWDTLAVLYQANFTQIHMLNENEGFFIGNGSGKTYLKKTNDGGLTWIDKISPTLGLQYNESLLIKKLITIDSQNLVAVGRGDGTNEGAIFSSNDGGENWDYALPFQALNDCAARSETIYFVGDELFVAKWELNTDELSNSNNISNNWQILDRDTDFLLSNKESDVVLNYHSLSQICFPDNKVGFLVSKKSNRFYQINFD